MTIVKEQLSKILEAALMASGQPLSIDQMLSLFLDEQQPSRDEIREALSEIANACENRGVELKQVGSGYRFQAKQDYAHWIARLWEEKPPRYSRALLETLVLIAYRQPITRSEIEDVRGVSVSSHIVKTLLEREWVRVVGHRDVPGKPALYATTRQFLDYFNMKSLEELPTLQEIRDFDKINAELDLNEPGAQAQSEEDAEAKEEAQTEEGAAAQETASEAGDVVDEAGVMDEVAEGDSPIEENSDSEERETVASETQSSADSKVESEEDDEVVATEKNETRAVTEVEPDDEEESDEMLYAQSQDEVHDDEAIDDKYADTSATHVIGEPDEPLGAITDGAGTRNALKT